MLKWIINGLLIYGAYKLFKGLKGGSAPDKKGKASSGSSEQTREGDLVEDPHCGVYIPVDQAFKGAGGNLFCSKECADAYKNSKEG